jgi:hypothetical protein
MAKTEAAKTKAANTKTAKVKASVPSVVRKMLGKRPIIGGEDAATYDQLLQLIIAEHSPQSLHQWLLIKDIADAAWELLRLSGMKAGVVNAAMPEALATLKVYGLTIDEGTVALLRPYLWAAVEGSAQAHVRLKKLLGDHDLSLDELAAAAFERTIGSQAQIDRMTTSTANRRDAAYAELARLRAIMLHEQRAVENASEVLQIAAQSPAPLSNGVGQPSDAGRAIR